MWGLKVTRWGAIAALCLILTSGVAHGLQAERTLEAAQEMIDAGRPDQALRLLEPLEKSSGVSPNESARGLLLRSTARFMLGQIEAGRRDLEAALQRDDTLRQGWLNRAALDISEGNLGPALEALEKARDLNPAAADNDLNIGAVLVMLGREKEAAPLLDRYVVSQGGSIEAHYLVASNYAMAGTAERAIGALAGAIELDERIRMRARLDPNFAALGSHDAFQKLLNTDAYRIPADSHAIYRTYDSRYLAGEGKLLPAVIDALQLLGEPFDRQVEVTPDWALIWGAMRIKVRNDGHQGGRVELTAPRSKFDREAWKARADRIFSEIAVQLAKR